MSKKITVSFTVNYKFKGDLLEEYLDQLQGNKDTKSQRKEFAIDRFIGFHNLPLFDRKAKLTVKESN